LRAVLDELKHQSSRDSSASSVSNFKFSNNITVLQQKSTLTANNTSRDPILIQSPNNEQVNIKNYHSNSTYKSKDSNTTKQENFHNSKEVDFGEMKFDMNYLRNKIINLENKLSI